VWAEGINPRRYNSAGANSHVHLTENERLRLVAKQLAALETKSQAELRAPACGSAAAKIAQLVDLKRIG
jgi:hypothetical protein